MKKRKSGCIWSRSLEVQKKHFREKALRNSATVGRYPDLRALRDRPKQAFLTTHCSYL